MNDPRHASQPVSSASAFMPLFGTATAFLLLLGIGTFLTAAAMMMM